jgi:multimeric flavodoxin WrbA
MSLKVLGISGSPIKNSNTDKLVKTVLDATGVDSEFVKLSEISVRALYSMPQMRIHEHLRA